MKIVKCLFCHCLVIKLVKSLFSMFSFHKDSGVCASSLHCHGMKSILSLLCHKVSEVIV